MLEDYKDNQFWLMKGDCLERMKEIESGSVDMILHPIAQLWYSVGSQVNVVKYE